VFRLPFTANFAPSSPILITLKMVALHSFETSVLTKGTWRNIPEDGILHSHRLENLKSYTINLMFSEVKILAMTVYHLRNLMKRFQLQMLENLQEEHAQLS
jgi:hypothetical protein